MALQDKAKVMAALEKAQNRAEANSALAAKLPQIIGKAHHPEDRSPCTSMYALCLRELSNCSYPAYKCIQVSWISTVSLFLGAKQLELLQMIEAEGKSEMKPPEKHTGHSVTGSSGDVAWSSDTLPIENRASDADFDTSIESKVDG